LQRWQIWTQVNINSTDSAWEAVRDNVKISAKESLGYYELMSLQ
jgi:hypothetical protein